MERRARRLRMPPPEPDWRPQTRADCARVPRPCPYVGCRYNMTLDITPQGSIRWRLPDPWDDPASGRDTCALDMAERGPHTLEQIGDVMGVTRERVRQEIIAAFTHVKDDMDGFTYADLDDDLGTD